MSGDIAATATFSTTSCPPITVSEAHGILATLVYVSSPGTPQAQTYALDIAGLSPGRSTFPDPAGPNVEPPRRVRLTADLPEGTVAWGTTPEGGGTVSGTINAPSAMAKTGSFDLDLGPFPGTPRGRVHLAGTWACP